jgi:hypothetical protein
MAALARITIDPVLEQAGILDTIPPIAEQLDTRAYVVISTRADAELMLMQDRLVAANDTAWTALFVESMVEFLVWQSQPCGRITESDLDWFLGLVADAPSQSVPALLFSLVRELNDVPERLTALAMKHADNRLAVYR